MKDPITYWRANEVRDIAEGLIADFHPHVAELQVRYIFRSKHTESHGRARLACVRKVGGLTAYLARAHEIESMPGPRPPGIVAESFFLMEVAADTWQNLTASQRIALVDHELKHIGPDGELRGHDVEEFSDIIARHGAWKPDLSAFVAASKQQPLFEPDLPRGGSTVDQRVH